MPSVIIPIQYFLVATNYTICDTCLPENAPAIYWTLLNYEFNSYDLKISASEPFHPVYFLELVTFLPSLKNKERPQAIKVHFNGIYHQFYYQSLVFFLFQIVFLLFCVIRRLVWDYGRLALIQKGDQGYESITQTQNNLILEIHSYTTGS